MNKPIALKLSNGKDSHFTTAEIACHCDNPNCEGKNHEWLAKWCPTEIVDFWEKVREVVGLPLKVNSGYRCKDYNAKIGGAPDSQHCHCGFAWDVTQPKGITYALFTQIIHRIAGMSKDGVKLFEFMCIITYLCEGWVHGDCRGLWKKRGYPERDNHTRIMQKAR